jgi:hypothetical protein
MVESMRGMLSEMPGKFRWSVGATVLLLLFVVPTTLLVSDSVPNWCLNVMILVPRH